MLPFTFTVFAACAFLVGIVLGAKMATATSRDQGDGDYREKPVPESEVVRPTETRNRFPADIRLRAAGFAIVSRPERGEPVWTRNGITFPESEAVLRIHRVEVP